MNVALRLARPPDQMDARDAGAQDAARSPTAKPAEEPQKEQEANAKPDQEPQEKDEGDGGFYHGISTAEPWFLCDGSAASSSVYVDV